MEANLFILLVVLASARSTQWRNKYESRTQLLQKDPKIIGGQEAPLHEFPYQAALYFDNKTYVGGCLISDRWVITTAFAAKTSETKPVAVLGAQYLRNNEFSQQRIQTDDIIIHELWDQAYSNNIALFHLDRAAIINSYVRPVMLAPFNAPDFAGSNLVMSGYGSIGDEPSPSQSLHYVIINGISNSDCQKILGNLTTDATMCVETTGGKGGCIYDVGGPLVDVDSSLLVGLTARYYCDASGTPDMFTRISWFNKWIVDKINVE